MNKRPGPIGALDGVRTRRKKKRGVLPSVADILTEDGQTESEDCTLPPLKPETQSGEDFDHIDHLSSDGVDDQDPIVDAHPFTIPDDPWVPLPGDDLTQVSYGMVSQIQCRRLSLTRNASLAGIPFEQAEEPDNVLLALQFQGRRCGVAVATDHPAFAQVNSKLNLVFRQATKFQGVQLECHAPRSQVLTFLKRNPASKAKADTFCISSNIYGPRCLSERVGALLSNHGIFLQDPTWLRPETAYQNPHKLVFDDVSEVDIWLRELTLNRSAACQNPQDTDWAVVLDDLRQHHTTSSITHTISLTTSLMKHQIDALDFMCKREVGDLEDQLRFWKLERSDGGVPVYRHAVTGAEMHERLQEPRGGIIADDMGLGKTLSAIALVTKSSDRAAYFAGKSSTDANGGKALPPSKTTLVVVPSMLILEDWRKEIDRHTLPGALKVTVYHGKDRVQHFSDLSEFDVVLTTYGTITAEYRKFRKVLFYLCFFRIILDEAHIIRSQRTRQFEAIMALEAQYHWCLTGTPISNKIEDLSALLRFCRVPLLEDRRCFQTYVTKVSKKSFRRGCDVLRQTLTPLCLRRTKALLKLPEPDLIYRSVDFSSAEAQQYRSILRYCRSALDATVSGRNVEGTRHTILQSILQLRIFCDQGTFMPTIESVMEEQLDADEALTLLQEKDEARCACCTSEVILINQLENAASGVVGACTHVVCAACYEMSSTDETTATGYVCPACREQTNQQTTLASMKLVESLQEQGTTKVSTKLNAVLEDLMDFQGREKSIVFSVWKKTLDIAASLCSASGIRHVRIDGSTSQADRRQALDRFVSDPTVCTLLMTLGTGALGLNLTVATRIHILEPQWNPTVEDQAIGRAVRIGQEKNATVIRYVVRDSVEEQIQGYQKRKIQLAAGGFRHGDDALAEAETKLLTATFFH